MDDKTVLTGAAVIGSLLLVGAAIAGSGSSSGPMTKEEELASRIESALQEVSLARQEIIRQALKKLGMLYQWGGGRTPHDYGVDCSGLIISATREAGLPLPSCPLSTSAGWWECLEHIDHPLPGDYAIYGKKSEGRPTHVELVLAYHDGVADTLSANGDSKVTSPEIAIERDAKVVYASTAGRKSFFGFVRNPIDQMAPGEPSRTSLALQPDEALDHHHLSNHPTDVGPAMIRIYGQIYNKDADNGNPSMVYERREWWDFSYGEPVAIGSQFAIAKNFPSDFFLEESDRGILARWEGDPELFVVTIHKNKRIPLAGGSVTLPDGTALVFLYNSGVGSELDGNNVLFVERCREDAFERIEGARFSMNEARQLASSETLSPSDADLLVTCPDPITRHNLITNPNLPENVFPWACCYVETLRENPSLPLMLASKSYLDMLYSMAPNDRNKVVAALMR